MESKRTPKLTPEQANFMSELDDIKQYQQMEELDMQYSPKAFQKEEGELHPIMMGWEWERKLKHDPLTTNTGKAVLKRVLSGPLQLYINMRYEVQDLEMVSIPATLASHKKWMDKFLFRDTVGIDSICSATTPTERGIHIHIEKKAFTQASLKRFFAFVSNPANRIFMTKIARRDIRRNRWCQPTKMTFEKNKEGKITNCNLKIDTDLELEYGSYNSKSVAINVFSEFDTVELRIFKTTNDKEVLYRNLEFADALTRFVAVHTFEELYAKDFMEYVMRNKKRYPHLSCDTNLIMEKKKTKQA